MIFVYVLFIMSFLLMIALVTFIIFSCIAIGRVVMGLFGKTVPKTAGTICLSFS